MKAPALRVLVALCLVNLLAGCGPSAPKVTSADMKTFESASPELKAVWTRAHAAARTNDYATAILALRSMVAQNLSVEQIEAVQNSIRAYNVKLMEAADRGDATAQKGLEAVRAGGRPER